MDISTGQSKLVVSLSDSTDCTDSISAVYNVQTSYVWLQVDEDCKDYTLSPSPSTLDDVTVHYTSTQGVFGSYALNESPSYIDYEFYVDKKNYKIS